MSKFLKSILVFVLALILLLLLLPGLMGMWVDQTIRQALHDLTQHGMTTYQVSDFHRGWFESSMVVVDRGGHAMPIDINHGPLLYHHHISIGMAEAYPTHPLGHFHYQLTVLFKLHGGVDVVVENGDPIMTHRFQAETLQYYIAIKNLQRLDQIHGHLQAKGLVFEPAHSHAEYHVQSAWMNFHQLAGAHASGDHDFLFDVLVKGVQAHLGEQDLESTPYRLDMHVLRFQRLHWQHVERWLALLNHPNTDSADLWSHLLLSMVQRDTAVSIQKASVHLKNPKDRVQVDGNMRMTFARLPAKHDWLDVLFLSDKQLNLDAHDWKTKRVRLEEGSLSFKQSSMDHGESLLSLQHLTLHLQGARPRPPHPGQVAAQAPHAVAVNLGSLDTQWRSSKDGAFVHRRGRLHGTDWCVHGGTMPMFCIQRLSGLMTVDHENALGVDPSGYQQMKSAWLSHLSQWRRGGMQAIMGKGEAKLDSKAKVLTQPEVRKPRTSLNAYYNDQTVMHSQLTMATTLFDAKFQSVYRPLVKSDMLQANLTISHVRDATIHELLAHGVQQGYVLKQGLVYSIPVLKRDQTLLLNGKVFQMPKPKSSPALPPSPRESHSDAAG